MQLFLTTVWMNIRVMFHYKKTFFISMLIFPITLLINMALFSKIYAYNGTQNIKGYSLSQMIWYFSAINLVWLFIWNFTDSRMSNKIISGTLTSDLLKPISVFRLELAHAVGNRLSGLALELIPTMIVNTLIFYPDFFTAASFGRFLLISVFAFILYFLLNFLLGLSAFVIKNNQSLNRLKFLLIGVFGGGMFPLEFYPEWMIKINDMLPFKYILYWPIQVFLNRKGTDTFNVFSKIVQMQIVWILILLIWVGIRDALFADVRWTVEDLVRQGGFDRLLLKPYPAIGILLADGISISNIGSLIGGTVISVISIIKLGIHIGPLQILLFLYFFICGIILSMAVNVLYCSINIMLIQMWRIGDFFNNLLRFAEYPADIYGDAARVIFVAVIPFAVWVYFPVQALLGRLDGFMVVGSLSCFVLFWLSLKFWGYCLKKYTSMGG